MKTIRRISYDERDPGVRVARIRRALAAELEPVNRELVRLHSLQPNRVVIGPQGVEIETAWSDDAAVVRDQLEEMRTVLTNRAFDAAGVPPSLRSKP